METYTTRSGDMWDSIAKATMGSENYTGELIRANMEYVETYIFPAGAELKIPKVTAPANTSLPPWKRREE